MTTFAEQIARKRALIETDERRRAVLDDDHGLQGDPAGAAFSAELIGPVREFNGDGTSICLIARALVDMRRDLRNELLHSIHDIAAGWCGDDETVSHCAEAYDALRHAVSDTLDPLILRLESMAITAEEIEVGE